MLLSDDLCCALLAQGDARCLALPDGDGLYAASRRISTISSGPLMVLGFALVNTESIALRPISSNFSLVTPTSERCPGKSQSTDELGEDVAGLGVRRVPGLGDFPLGLIRHGLIVSQDARHHDRRTEIVWNIAGPPKHVSDRVARTHRNTTLQSEGGHPGTELAKLPRFQIVRVFFRGQQAIIEVSQTSQAYAFHQRIAPRRADRFDPVIHRAGA